MQITFYRKFNFTTLYFIGLFNSLLYVDTNFPNATVCNCMPECSDTTYSMTMVNENINKSSSISNSQ